VTWYALSQAVTSLTTFNGRKCDGSPITHLLLSLPEKEFENRSRLVKVVNEY